LICSCKLIIIWGCCGNNRNNDTENSETGKNFVNAPSISQVTPVNADADYEDDPWEKEIEEAHVI